MFQKIQKKFSVLCSRLSQIHPLTKLPFILAILTVSGINAFKDTTPTSTAILIIGGVFGSLLGCFGYLYYKRSHR